MRPAAREYFTVDLRGLRAALAARAAAESVTESDVLRSALVAKLGPEATVAMPPPRISPTGGRRSCSKLSIRLPHLAAHQLDGNARAAGLSRGAYLARLIEGVVPVVASSDRAALANALNQSAEELSVFSRDIHHLTGLLGKGSVQAARQYTRRLETLDADVRRHLERDAKVLAELSSARSTERPRKPVLPMTTGRES